MERSRRKVAAVQYSISSDDEATNDDDSSFALDDSLEFNHESKSKKKTNSQRSKDKSDVPAKRKANCRPSKRKASDEFASSCNTNEIACGSGIKNEPSSSPSGSTETKRRRKNTSERPQLEKIKLENPEIVPDLSKVKTERVSLVEFPNVPVNRIKSEKSDECNESRSDLKPNLKRIKAEMNFDSSDESEEDCKLNLQKVKLEKGIKEDPDMASEKSTKSVTKVTKVKSEVKQEGSIESTKKATKKVKTEVKQESDSSQPPLKKPRKVKNEVKYEPDPSQDGDINSHRLSVIFFFIFV